MQANRKINTCPISKIISLAALFFCLSILGVSAQEMTSNEVKSSLRPEATYDFKGTVLRCGDGEMVINDRLLYLAKFAKYHYENGLSGELVSKKIKPGTLVGFKLNDKKKITDIWIIKEN